MRPEALSRQALSKLLHAHQVMTMAELVQRFKCSQKTIARRLVELNHITSYNQNRTGLSLQDIPDFDAYGLWNYKQFRFSKLKTLNETIRHLVENSSAGLSAGQLAKILDTNVYHHVSVCARENRIYRDSLFRPPIYFHTDPVKRQSQQIERRVLAERTTPEKPPLSKENIIRILVAVIKHHATTINELMPVLLAEHIDLSSHSVEWVLKKYDIEKKGSP